MRRRPNSFAAGMWPMEDFTLCAVLCVSVKLDATIEQED
jgi:hypothetical protein